MSKQSITDDVSVDARLAKGRETDAATLSAAVAQVRSEMEQTHYLLQEQVYSEASAALHSSDPLDLPAVSALAAHRPSTFTEGDDTGSSGLAFDCAYLVECNDALRAAHKRVEADRLAHAAKSGIDAASAYQQDGMSLPDRAKKLVHSLECLYALSDSDSRKADLLYSAEQQVLPQLLHECDTMIDSAVSLHSHDDTAASKHSFFSSTDGNVNAALCALEVLPGESANNAAIRIATALIKHHFSPSTSATDAPEDMDQEHADAMIDAVYADTNHTLQQLLHDKPCIRRQFLQALSHEAAQGASNIGLCAKERWHAEELVSLERARLKALEWEEAHEQLQQVCLSAVIEQSLKETASLRKAQRLKQVQHAVTDGDDDGKDDDNDPYTNEDAHEYDEKEESKSNDCHHSQAGALSLDTARQVLLMVSADVSHFKQLGLQRFTHGMLVDTAFVAFYTREQPPYRERSSLFRAKVRSDTAQSIAQALLEAQMSCAPIRETKPTDHHRVLLGTHQLLNTALQNEVSIARDKGKEAAGLAGMLSLEESATTSYDKLCEALRTLGARSMHQYIQRKIHPARATICELHANACSLLEHHTGLASADQLAAEALNAMSECAIHALLQSSDVPAQQAEALSSVIASLCDARGLPQGAVERSHRLASLRELGSMFDQLLRTITSRFESGELRKHFTALQVQHIVESVFEDTPLRRSCLQRIHESAASCEQTEDSP